MVQQDLLMRGKGVQGKEGLMMAKLAHIHKTDELKKIYRNVDEQNEALRSDIISLKYKVELLLEKQKSKLQQSEAADQGNSIELAIHQKELKDQYKIMQELKKRMEQSHHANGTEELNEQYHNLANHIKNTEHELAQLKVTAADLKNETARLQTSLAAIEEEEKRNQPKITEFSQENGELRRKILSMKKLSVEKEYQSAKVMNSMYSIKGRYSKNEQTFNELEKKKSLVKPQPAKMQMDIAALQKEVVNLKKQVQKTEQFQLRSEAQLLKRKEELMSGNKEEMKKFKELEDRRTKAQMELNKYKKVWERYIEMKNNNKLLKEYAQTAMQAEEYQPEESLRRDFAGIIGGKVQFDDRVALKENKKSFMTGFYIYEMEHTASSKNMLIAIRAIYDDAEASANNEVPLPGHYLSKCKMSKYTFVEGDFIKLLKVKYNSTDNRILKLEVRTNKNNRYEFGDKRPFHDVTSGENVYGFDISIQEYPVCLFGSYNNLRSHWYMESLGVEINDL